MNLKEAFRVFILTMAVGTTALVAWMFWPYHPKITSYEQFYREYKKRSLIGEIRISLRYQDCAYFAFDNDPRVKESLDLEGRSYKNWKEKFNEYVEVEKPEIEDLVVYYLGEIPKHFGRYIGDDKVISKYGLFPHIRQHGTDLPFREEEFYRNTLEPQKR